MCTLFYIALILIKAYLFFISSRILKLFFLPSIQIKLIKLVTAAAEQPYPIQIGIGPIGPRPINLIGPVTSHVKEGM